MSFALSGRHGAARCARAHLLLRRAGSLALVAAVALLSFTGVPSVPALDRADGPVASADGPVTSAPVRLAAYRLAHQRTRAVHLAAAQRGKPYRYGASGPHAFDCSGLTHWVYDVKMHRHIPRTSAAQYGASRHISKKRIRRGDLVFFVHGNHVYHVGIYAGHHRIWHAPHTGARVRLEHIWTSHWRAGRVLH